MPGDGPDTVQDEGGQAHGLLLRAAILQSPWEGPTRMLATTLWLRKPSKQAPSGACT